MSFVFVKPEEKIVADGVVEPNRWNINHVEANRPQPDFRVGRRGTISIVVHHTGGNDVGKKSLPKSLIAVNEIPPIQDIIQRRKSHGTYCINAKQAAGPNLANTLVGLRNAPGLKAFESVRSDRQAVPLSVSRDVNRKAGETLDLFLLFRG